MSDKDNITLPREVAQLALDALHYAARPPAGDGLYAKEIAILRTRLAAPQPEPVRHPGYVIGNHWFETAYERLCAGEAEDAILEDYELVREPRLRDLRRDAERYRWLRGMIYDDRIIVSADTMLYGEALDAAIDAAMEPAKYPAIRAREDKT